jgi:hypothetical protein
MTRKRKLLSNETVPLPDENDLDNAAMDQDEADKIKGLDNYRGILSEYYPSHTFPRQIGNEFELTRNPFNEDKRTLKIQIVDGSAHHYDIEGGIAPGDALDFAEHHFGLTKGQLFEVLDALTRRTTEFRSRFLYPE